MNKFVTVLSIFSIFVQLLISFGAPQRVEAEARNIFPHDSHSPDSMAVVARVGGSYQLDATEVSFRIFVPAATTADVVVTFRDACYQRVWGDWATVFQLWRAPATEEPLRDENNGNTAIPDGLEPYREFSTANCVGNDVSMSIPAGALTTSSVVGHELYKTLVAKALHVGSGGGINGFNVAVSNVGAKVVHRELPLVDVANNGVPVSYQSFAILSNNFPGPRPGEAGYPTAEDNYTFKFAASCEYSSPVAYIKWSDADYNGPNEDGDIAFQLIDERTGLAVPLDIYDSNRTLLATSVTTVSNENIGGDEAGNSGATTPFRSAGFTLDPDTRYSWEWTNVQERNGVQIWMPFSEVNYGQSCPSAGYDGDDFSDCNAISGWAANLDDASEVVSVLIYVRLANANIPFDDDVVTANLSSPTSPVGAGHGFSYPVNSAYKSGTINTVYTIIGNPGTADEFYIARTASLGICGTPASVFPPSCDFPDFVWRWYPPHGYAYDLFQPGFWSVSGAISSSGTAGHFGRISMGPYVSSTSGISAWASASWAHFAYVPPQPDPAATWTQTGTHFVSAGATYPPCAWNYRLAGSASPPSSNPYYFPKPGDSITASGSVTNIGAGAGPGYTVTVRPTGLGAAYVSPSSRSYSGGSLAGSYTPGGGVQSRSHSFGTWVLASNAQDNLPFCITATLTPTSGGSHPTIQPGGGSQSVDLGCYTIFNKRFDINDDVNVTMVPDNIFPGDNSTATAEVDVEYFVANNDLAELSAQYPGATLSTAYGLTYSITASGTANPTLVSNTLPASTIGPGAESQGTARLSVPSTALPGQTVCVTLTIIPERGYSILTPISEREAAGMVVTTNTCERVGEQPYIEIYGADAWAGGQWDPNVEGGFWCPLVENPISSPAVPRSTNTAYIRGARRGGVGAFVQYAATALDEISEFATSRYQNNDLTFQNDTALGYFHSEGKCVVDYYEYLNKDTSNSEVDPYVLGTSVAQTGQFFTAGNVTLSGDTIGSNQMILIVDGDVTINGNIEYGNYSITDPDDLPFFMLVASGNINIADNVTVLDGVYVSKGQIDTCFNGPTRLSLTTCPQQLTIHGMFIADDVQFRRTFSGVVRNSAGAARQAAELFEFSPELYLADPPFVSNFSRNFKVDQIKDLPPVY